MWLMLCILYATLSGFMKIKSYNMHLMCLQCFDAVGWVAGKASGL